MIKNSNHKPTNLPIDAGPDADDPGVFRLRSAPYSAWAEGINPERGFGS